MDPTQDKYCVPWFVPRLDIDEQKVVEICDPWDAENFTIFMRNTPQDNCLHCLPDCSITQYESVVSTVPFRDCDEKNLGVR